METLTPLGTLTAVLITGAATALLALLLKYEKRQYRIGMLAAKTPLSALFVLTAAILPHPSPQYGQWVLAALILSLAGDMLLALGTQIMFRCGLVAFLTAHVFYIIAFFLFSGINLGSLGCAVVASTAAVIVYDRLRPHLGDMKRPVQIYILVISIMLVLALGVLGRGELTASARFLIPCGALLFYVSDLFVARDRFIRCEFLNRLFGLPLYYAGQFALALSTAVV